MQIKQPKENRLNVYIDPQLVLKAKLRATINNVSLASLVEDALNEYLKDTTFDMTGDKVRFISSPTTLTQQMAEHAGGKK